MADDDPGEGERSGWQMFAKVLAIVLGVFGFVALGAMILFTVAMNSWANNK